MITFFSTLSHMDMKAHVTVVAGEDTEDEVRSLYQWLKDGDHADPIPDLVPSVLSEDSMGTGTDTIAVVFGSGSAVATFASSLFSWLKHRRSDVHLSIRTATGDSLEIDATGLASADEFAHDVIRLMGGDGNAPAGQ